jgi:hypothetical protein
MSEKPLYDFWAMIEDAIDSAGLPRNSGPIAFYPSQSSIRTFEYGKPVVKGSCIRQVYWSKTGEPITDPSSRDQGWRAEMGNWISQMLVEWCKRAGTYVADEYSFTDTERNIRGRIDLIYRHPITKELVGCEIKSIGDYYQRKGTVSGNPMELAPKIYHLLQVGCYIDYFEFHPTMPIKTWIIPYIARCTGERNCFTISRDSAKQLLVDGAPTGITTDMIHERNKELQEYLDKQEVPPRDFELQYSKERLLWMAKTGLLTSKQATDVNAGKKLVKGDGSCSFCSYKTKCWPEEAEKKQEKKIRRAPK